jgi:hypothetical protein
MLLGDELRAHEELLDGHSSKIKPHGMVWSQELQEPHLIA